MAEKQYLIDSINVDNSWRLFKILAEFVDGFETLGDLYPAVTIFGSARVKPGDETYEKTYEIAKKLCPARIQYYHGRGTRGDGGRATRAQRKGALNRLGSISNFRSNRARTLIPR